ncbi:GlxA family transcriptional regulator [Brachybacterium sp. EE-P12]|uniref:GlxA family transcriptional regulator n=1 Tax=Brachybacterium sp. EE-P12 TaxID=2306299 RepID=UPI000F07C8CA|nr:helix-turn-helix domain-containing protein [Brachybacterium sp. EE-P12]
MESCQVEEGAVRIGIFAVEGSTMFHLAVPQMVFDEVARQGLAPWETFLFAERAGAVTTSEGYCVDGVAGWEAAAEAEMIVVPTWHADGRRADEEMATRLADAHRRGAVVVGLCLGAIPVVDAGLLEGRAAVTHWQAFEDLRSRHPGLELDETVLYIDHGDVLTSAGTASGLDACLHLVRSRLGAAAATAVARSLVIAPHREGGQAQYIEHPVPEQDEHDQLSRALAWALEHLHEPLPAARLARAAHMSPRTFARAFPAAMGTTAAVWVAARRVDTARRLLETTDRSVEQIAGDVGWGSAVTMRQAFARSLGITPTQYRRQFRDR